MKIDEAIIRFVSGQDFVYDIDIAHYPMHKPKIFNNYKVREAFLWSIPYFLMFLFIL